MSDAPAVVWRRELPRFQADRLRIVSALVQPVLFLLLAVAIAEFRKTE